MKRWLALFLLLTMLALCVACTAAEDPVAPLPTASPASTAESGA